MEFQSEQNQVDNQHRKIAGYRDLSQEDIDLINAITAHEQAALGLVATVQARLAATESSKLNPTHAADMARFAIAEPKRWAAVSKTHIQEGASALVRAVAQPT